MTEAQAGFARRVEGFAVGLVIGVALMGWAMWTDEGNNSANYGKLRAVVHGPQCSADGKIWWPARANGACFEADNPELKSP
jgi:hypothetical protein